MSNEPAATPDGADDPAGALAADFRRRLLMREDLRNLPEPEPLIENVLDLGTTALLYGNWGTGKTFIALDWATAIATGRNWQGRTTKQRRVLYVIGEGANGLNQRVTASEAAWGDIENDALVTLPIGVNLTDMVQTNALCRMVQDLDIEVIILDTLARCMVGADENSSRDGGVVVEAMTRLVEAAPDQRGTVIGVHHTGKDGKTLRGTTALEAGVDTVYFAESDGAAIRLTRKKRRDGPVADEHRLRLDPIPGTGSVTLAAFHDAPGTRTESEDRLLKLLTENFSATGASRVQILELAMAAGLAKSTLYRTLNSLLERDVLVNEGTQRRPFYRLQNMP